MGTKYIFLFILHRNYFWLCDVCGVSYCISRSKTFSGTCKGLGIACNIFRIRWSLLYNGGIHLHLYTGNQRKKYGWVADAFWPKYKIRYKHYIIIVFCLKPCKKELLYLFVRTKEVIKWEIQSWFYVTTFTHYSHLPSIDNFLIPFGT